MSTQPEAMLLSDAPKFQAIANNLNRALAEIENLRKANLDVMMHFNALMDERNELLAVLKELQESASYWGEYDVPLGIVDRINAAIAKAEA